METYKKYCQTECYRYQRYVMGLVRKIDNVGDEIKFENALEENNLPKIYFNINTLGDIISLHKILCEILNLEYIINH